MEVTYPLQRMESYDGLLILATNLRDHILEIALAYVRDRKRHAGQPTPGQELGVIKRDVP